jgi:hypothetical protein
LFTTLRIAGFIPFLFAIDIAINFIRLDVCGFDVADSGIVKAGALLTNGCQDVQDRFLVKASQAACGTHANAFAEKPDNAFNLLGFDSQSAERLFFRKCFAATLTAEATHNTILVSEIGEMFGFPVTAEARCHFGLDFLSAMT